MNVNGRGVRINNRNLALEVRSIHPGFTPAGAAAKNIILPLEGAAFLTNGKS